MRSSNCRDLDQLFCCLNKRELVHKQRAKGASHAADVIYGLSDRWPVVYIENLSAQISLVLLYFVCLVLQQQLNV